MNRQEWMSKWLNIPGGDPEIWLAGYKTAKVDIALLLEELGRHDLASLVRSVGTAEVDDNGQRIER